MAHNSISEDFAIRELFDRYTTEVEGTRSLLKTHAVIRRLLAPDLAPDLLLRFLLEYSARAVQITKPVDSWIRRAGDRCVALGLPEIGESLRRHADHEAGHDQMLVDDVRALVPVWNARHPDAPVDAVALLAAESTPAMRAYIALHEDSIVGEHPFAQVAIELEIERMSVDFGPPLVEQCKRVLGGELPGLSFIQEHVALDIGHTHLNTSMLRKLLAARPDALPVLVQTGQSALRAYIDIFGECLVLAERALA